MLGKRVIRVSEKRIEQLEKRVSALEKLVELLFKGRRCVICKELKENGLNVMAGFICSDCTRTGRRRHD